MGTALLILCPGPGLYLTLRLGFLQIRYLPRALGYLFARGANKGKGMCLLCRTLYGISRNHRDREYRRRSYRGTSGRPRRNFWMWLVALLGMANQICRMFACREISCTR